MKHFICLLAGICIMGPAIAQNPSPPDKFVDVPEDHWAYQSVENLRKRGIIVGYPDRNLRGKRTVTRYEAAAGLNRFVDVVERAIPQRRTTSAPGTPGPQGVRGPAGRAGSPGQSPKEVDIYRELIIRLKSETEMLRKEITSAEAKTAESSVKLRN